MANPNLLQGMGELLRFCELPSLPSFITGFAGRAAILYELTGTPKKKWTWNEKHTRAFEELKKAVTSAPVLAFPNSEDHFILDTDALDFAVGVELSQVQQTTWGRENYFIRQQIPSSSHEELLYDSKRIVGSLDVHAALSSLFVGASFHNQNGSR